MTSWHPHFQISMDSMSVLKLLIKGKSIPKHVSSINSLNSLIYSEQNKKFDLSEIMRDIPQLQALIDQ